MLERPEFNLTRTQAIKLLLSATTQGNDFWVKLVSDYFDQATNTMPTIYDVLRPLGISKEEIDIINKN